ncbi:MAG: hypothetical protein KJO33_08380 [Gammaproteobacteria bacterium]|nr:hypothetical protein [Gammaproteobacteria bacterium]
MFWSLAAAAVFVAALITFYPLLRGKTFWQPAGLALIFVVPAVALWSYQSVGTPSAIDLPAQKPQARNPIAQHSEGAGDMQAMVSGLRQRLEANPEDLQGWMLLARSYQSMERYPETVEALEKAHSIAPDNPFIMTELAEAWIFVSQDGRIGENSIEMLQRSLAMEPEQQKALWLLGIAASQAGEFEYAIEQWETVLGMMEPGSQAAQTLQAQIDEARQALATEGVALSESERPVTRETPTESAAATPVAAASPPEAESTEWRGTRVNVLASAELPASAASSAVLYVMIRSPGMAVGPPIGVRRIEGPQLPLELTLTDQDSMMKERRISFESEIQIQARLSLSGSVMAGPGDWQSAPVTVRLDADGPVGLTLDQRVE